MSCSSLKVRMMKYIIKHSISRMNCIAMRKLWKRNIGGYHFKILFYRNLYWDRMVIEYFGEGALLVSTNDIRTCEEHILEGLQDSNESLHNAWIVPAALHLRQSTDGSWSLDKDLTSTLVRQPNSKISSVEFGQITFLEIFYDLKQEGFLVG